MKKLNSMLSIACAATMIALTSCGGDPMVTITPNQDTVVINMADLETPFLTGGITATDDYIIEEYYTINLKEAVQGIESYCFDTVLYTKDEKKQQDVFDFKLNDFNGPYISMLPMLAQYVSSITITVNCTETNATVTLPIKFINNEDLTESPMQWKREGGNDATGLEQFGLQWTSNMKEVFCVIRPVEGAKLVVFPEGVGAAAYQLTNSAELATYIDAIPAAEDFRGVSATRSNDYDLYIGSVYNGQYFIMHITKGTVETANAGTTITIDGAYKTKVLAK